MIIINESFSSHQITSLLRKHIEVQVQKNCDFDFKCNSIGTVVVTSSSISADNDKEITLRRLRSLKCSFGVNCALIVCVDRKDPGIKLLNWIDLEVGVTLGIKTMLCWSFEHVASFMTGLSTASAASVETATVVQESDEALPTLQRAFSEATQLLQSSDIVRLANRKNSVAEFLLSTDTDMSKIPGFGDKKMRRFMSLVHTPFVCSSSNAEEIHRPFDSEVSKPTSRAHNDMKIALKRFEDAEDLESD